MQGNAAGRVEEEDDAKLSHDRLSLPPSPRGRDCGCSTARAIVVYHFISPRHVSHVPSVHAKKPSQSRFPQIYVQSFIPRGPTIPGKRIQYSRRGHIKNSHAGDDGMGSPPFPASQPTRGSGRPGNSYRLPVTAQRPLHGSRLPPSETKGQHFFRIGTVVLHRTAKLGTPLFFQVTFAGTPQDIRAPKTSHRLTAPDSEPQTSPPVLLTSNRSACLSESMYPVLTT